MNKWLLCTPAPRLAMDAPRLALETAKAWGGKQELTVAFMDGDRRAWERVRTLIDGERGWNAYTSLPFRFDQNAPNPEIRVAFDVYPGGRWCYTGTTALGVPANLPTLHLAGIAAGDDEESDGVILHEFGHALGLMHEHLRADFTPPWNYPVVYHYYWRELGWSREQTNDQVIIPVDRATTQLSPGGPDRESVMMYRFPEEFFTLPGWGTLQNNRISAGDIAAARAWLGEAVCT